MGIFSAILGIGGVQSSSEKIGNITDISVYHDGVDYEFESRGGKVRLLSQTEGNTVPDSVTDAAMSEADHWR